MHCACRPNRHDPGAVREAVPSESDLSREPALVRDWSGRLLADEPQVRAETKDTLIGAGERSLPLLHRFLRSHDEDVQHEAFDIARRISPPAIELLADVLVSGRASVRRQAADTLIDLAPASESAQPRLRRALGDRDVQVARDAARALGALRERAAPSVTALVDALGHDDAHVRLYAAEALAAIGPKASGATSDLSEALHDAVPGVRWAACEALGGIGPAAAPAVPKLIEALRDESLYVRLCAASALGQIGRRAEAARQPLRDAASEPALRFECQWALSRIAETEPAAAAAPPAAITVPVSERRAPTTTSSGNPPIEWDTTTGRNIVWSVELGDETFGRPVVAGEVVYVGTDNGRRRNPACVDACGVLLAFRARDGALIWQDAAPRVERGMRQFLLPSTTSAPYVEGNRLYYVTAECQLRCLDTDGFGDGENDGPFVDERFHGMRAADIVWELDLCGLGVFPHEACNSEVLPIGELLIVGTSNGQNEGHTRVLAPRAPSLVAAERHSGSVVWSAIGAGENVLHGQWCSPVAASVKGRTQVLFGGGDGWLRAYDAQSGSELWRFDGNPKDARWVPRPGVLSRSPIIASPVWRDDRVYVAMGEDPSHGDGPSLLHAVSTSGAGDVTASGRIWSCGQIGRVVGTPVMEDELLYVGDLGGTVYCVEAAGGEVIWKHETQAAIWGCLALAGSRVYAGNEDGEMTVLRAGRTKEVLARVKMDAPLYSRPAIVGDSLYLATARRMYLIGASDGTE